MLAVGQSWIKAEVEHDQGTLMRVLDPNFVVTSGSGKPIDKAAFIAEAMRSTFASQKVAHDVVHVDNHTAVIVGTDTVFPSDSTQKIMTVRYTTMYECFAYATLCRLTQQIQNETAHSGVIVQCRYDLAGCCRIAAGLVEQGMRFD